MNAPPAPVASSQEQLRYAALLDWSTRAGWVVLVLTFVVYALGWPSPHVPVEKLPQLWSLPVAQYLQQTQSPQGWGWVALLPRSDVAGLLGIAILAGCSLVCLLALVPIYLRRGDRAFVALCLAEVLVVLLAASGWLGVGH